MPMKPKEMVAFLKSNGFVEISQTGSHLKMKNFATGVQVIVPIHSKDLKKGTENAIKREAGLK